MRLIKAKYLICAVFFVLCSCSKSEVLLTDLNKLKHDDCYGYMEVSWGVSPEEVSACLDISFEEPQVYYSESGEYAFDLYEVHDVSFAGESWEGHFQFNENGLWAVSLMLQDEAKTVSKIYDELSSNMIKVYGDAGEQVSNSKETADTILYVDTLKWSMIDERGESYLSLTYNHYSDEKMGSGLAVALKWEDSDSK